MMRTKFFISLLTLLLVTTGLAWGQTEITIDHIDGLTTDGTMPIDGSTATIHFRLTNINPAGGNIIGWTNGFRIYSTTGATWTGTSGAFTGTITPSMAEQTFVNTFSVDGALSDTIAFSGFRLFATGIPNTFDAIAWTVTVGPFDPAGNGGDFCIDSSYFRPAGGWKWSTTAGDVDPHFPGPYCYTVGTPSSNTAPVLNPIGNKMVDEGANLHFTVSAIDAESDPLTFSITATDLPPGYTFVDGVFDWTPTFLNAGVYSVTFEVSDGTETDTETISILVANVNQVPVLDPIGNKAVDETVNLNFVINGSDPDPDALIFSMTSPNLPVGATFNPGTRTFDWTPTYDDAGVYSATFSVTDGLASDEETITITVNNVNRAPSLNAIGDQATDENVNLTFTVTGSDPDSDPLTYSITATDLPMGYSFVGGVFDWTPAYTDAGVYSATFEVSDGSLTAQETIAITVNNVNRTPSLDAIGDKTIDEGANLNFAVNGSDPDGDILTYSITATDLPAGYTFAGGVFNWTPGFDDAGVYSATFEVSDGVLTASETIAITVNDSPRWTLDPIGAKDVFENDNLNFTVTYSNPDAVALTLTATNLPAGATFIGGVFDWSTTYDDAGVYDVTFSLDDGVVVKQEIVTITVHNVNRAPVIDPVASQSVDENANLNFAVTGSDPDADAVTFSITVTDLPAGYTFIDGIFDWTPSYDDAGVYTATFQISDGELTAETSATITVNNINRIPSFDPALTDQTVDEGTNLNFVVNGSDADGDALTYTITSTNLPVGYSFAGGVFDWTPTYSDAGIYTVTFEISDGMDAVNQTITITVNNISQWALSPIGDKSTDENVNLNFTITYVNPDLVPLTLGAVGLPGSATLVGDIFDWTPSYDDAGVYEVTFSLTDGITINEETITITVFNVNRAPMLDAIGDKIIDENMNLTFTATGSDPDGDAVTFAISATDLPAGYTFVGGVFDWTPSYDNAGIYSATIQISDGSLTAEETISITVNDVNRTPSLDAIGNKTVAENSNLNFTVSGSDPDGDLITFAITATDLPAGYTFINGVFDWTPGFDDEGVYFVTISVSDGSLFAEETITITVTGSNRAPEIAAISNYTISECDFLTVDFSAVDPDGDAVTFSIAGLVDSMIFTDHGNGTATLTFNPGYNHEGIYNMILSASDGISLTDQAFMITVEDCLPPYIITIDNPTTVPGSRQAVAINYGNVCELTSFTGTFAWTTDYLYLDSVSFTGSGIAYLSNEAAVIDNVAHTVVISASVLGGQTNIPAGGGLLATLYFSIDANTPDDLYTISTASSELVYNCGEGAEITSAYSIDGGIGVHYTESFTCGTVIDEHGNPIEGSTVELWDDFPFAKGNLQTVVTNSFGSFAFDNITVGTFSLYAYKRGYYPGIEKNLNPPATGLMIVQESIPFVVETPYWMDFYCAANTLNEMPVPVGSIIDAYTEDDIHVGSWYVSVEGSYGFMPVYGTLAGVDQAADPGDVIRFFINKIEAIPSHTPVWTAHGDRDEVCLAASLEITQSCELVEGWNLVSWRTDTPVDQIATVLTSIADCIDVVLGFESGGLTYDPILPQFSTLKEVDHLSGYWIKIKPGCSNLLLEINGSPVPETTPIHVTKGWNLVSYLPELSLPTGDALVSLNGNLDVAFGYDSGAMTYIPGDQFSDLLEMSSCFGYWVKVFSDDILSYPGNGKAAPAKTLSTAKLASDAGKSFNKSNQWVNIYSYNLTLDGIQVSSGAEITALNSNGDVVGSFTIGDNGLFGFMSVYADDPSTAEIDGVKQGETFYLAVNSIETNEAIAWTQSGDRIEVAALTTSGDSKGLPISYSLSQNYPNPFNPTTTIKFSMAKDGIAKLEIFNILGELVATPYNGRANAGANEVMWDGNDNNGKTVSSGIYFYRLTADNYSETKKMTLLK